MFAIVLPVSCCHSFLAFHVNQFRWSTCLWLTIKMRSIVWSMFPFSRLNWMTANQLWKIFGLIADDLLLCWTLCACCFTLVFHERRKQSWKILHDLFHIDSLLKISQGWKTCFGTILLNHLVAGWFFEKIDWWMNDTIEWLERCEMQTAICKWRRTQRKRWAQGVPPFLPQYFLSVQQKGSNSIMCSLCEWLCENCLVKT